MRLQLPTKCNGSSVRMGNAEGVRRGAEDRAPKARRVSMQLGGLGESCKLPSGSGRSQAAKRHLVHFWSVGLKMLYPARPSLAKTYMLGEVLPRVPAHSGRIRTLNGRPSTWEIGLADHRLPRAR